MDLDWTILHKNMHKKSSFLSRDLLRCEESLIWKNILNQQWIFMVRLRYLLSSIFLTFIKQPFFNIFQAAMIAFTTKFSPSITRPQFEGGL